jgi:N utilization substance protein B
MSTRRHERELALQALFYAETSGLPPGEALELFCAHLLGTGEKAAQAPPEFFLTLYHGVMDHLSRVDALIERHSTNWKLQRMSGVDRNVLRVAVYEMLFCPDIPPKVSINEAIDIGKKFGAGESGSFINGILDSVLLSLGEGRKS